MNDSKTDDSDIKELKQAANNLLELLNTTNNLNIPSMGDSDISTEEASELANEINNLSEQAINEEISKTGLEKNEGIIKLTKEIEKCQDTINEIKSNQMEDSEQAQENTNALDTDASAPSPPPADDSQASQEKDEGEADKNKE